MRALVTGAAGFIGSHLSEALSQAGHQVRGVDAFTDYYDVAIKRRNALEAGRSNGVEILEADLLTCDLEALLDGVDVVYHQAGQPGVRLSWAEGFERYNAANVLATQRLLEAVRVSGVRRLVYASSSSVYGNAAVYPTPESALPAPHSPYGVTKLAGEHLCNLYAANWGVSTVALRYFTVFGPRQRPDMAMHRFIDAAMNGGTLCLYGDGEQVRDFTFVADVVAANLAAGEADVAPGTVVNVAGGGSVSVNGLLALLEELVEGKLDVQRLPDQPGDVRATGGTIARAAEQLHWHPQVDVATGLARQLEWQRAAQLVPAELTSTS